MIYSQQNQYLNELNFFGFGKKQEPIPPKKSWIEERNARREKMANEEDIYLRNKQIRFENDVHNLADEIRQRQAEEAKRKKMFGNSSNISQVKTIGQIMDERKKQAQRQLPDIALSAGQAGDELRKRFLAQRFKEDYITNYYDSYLFKNPLLEDYFDEDIIINYFNENYTDYELNEMYNYFLVDIFGEEILDENYYDFICNEYGEDILLEGFWDNLKSAFGFGNKPKQQQKERLRYIPTPSKPQIPAIRKEPYSIAAMTRSITDPSTKQRLTKALNRNAPLAQRIYQTYHKPEDPYDKLKKLYNNPVAWKRAIHYREVNERIRKANEPKHYFFK